MAFELMELPYGKRALEPHISRETLDYHHGKHHQKYVDTLNGLIEGTADADKSLEEIIQSSEGKLFNQAAQVWNHNFYWQGLSPEGGGEPSGELLEAINKQFGEFKSFRETFDESAKGNFASGWTWLVKFEDGKLGVVNTDDADTPVAHKGVTPLLTVDVWEHAYYIDYRNARPEYLAAFWELVNWDFVAENLRKAS
ncbi:Fe-Mn family superoxide dismutase [Litorivivens lipolytica]|uniref:Superoxide dismutase n=1 Tax=Litorivivens lipolytica TaxID=1524264 RepID=A0A7W4W3D8_9GAMM|nr:Fe-Mn family superoxide dismutase [Litorivivens lipolytica]MBB3046644.1 Fe-Mn family superoxide dismutase [Litorivivens lipolytica]